MRFSQALLLLFAAAAHSHPVDNDAAAPASTADTAAPTITAPPEQFDLELEKRQESEDNSTTLEDDVTRTTTITNVETITDFDTVTTETTSTSTVIGTSTVFTTITETVDNVETATKTEYTTVTTTVSDDAQKRWLHTEPTPYPRDLDAYRMQPRAPVVLVKRATVFVTETASEKTTVQATTTDVKRVVVKTTSYTTVESTITTTEYDNAATTVTTTSTIVVTTLAEDDNPTYTEDPTETGTDAGGSTQTGDSDSGSGSGSSGLSNNAKLGIGLGVGLGGAALLAGIAFCIWKRKKANRPEPEWYDPHTDLNNNANVPSPTVPNLSPSPGQPAEMAETGAAGGGYRGAAGPGTAGAAAAAGGAALGAGAVAASGRKSWGGSTEPTVSPPSRFTTPAEAPYPAGGRGGTPPGGYAEMPNEPSHQQPQAGMGPVNEMDGGQTQHAVEADSRPVVFEAPDRKYT